jgi:energy-coupling factor transporter ATP-binding protein EcfA2
MSFAARYPGTCSTCKNPIVAGELINWNRKERGVIFHAACAPAPAPAKSAEEVLSTVLNEHAPTPTPVEAIEPPVEAPAPKIKSPISKAKSKADTSVPSDLLSGFAAALMPHIESRLSAKVDSTEIDTMIASYLAANPPSAPLTIKVEPPSGEATTIENAHAQMPKLLYLISKNHHTYLYGAPGSGKSTAAAQAAKALNLTYGYISLNPQTPESRLLGFVDATGTYRPTVFHDIYKNGGVFCIDEIDNASPALLTTLNGCLENGIASFPCGMVERHASFICIGTGNTSGRGASYLFPERRPFDAAMADRFTFLSWDYDLTLERAIALAYNPNAATWVSWVQAVRAHVETNKIRLIVSPRVSYKGAQYLADSTLTKPEIADALLFKGIDPAIKAAILDKVSL